MRLEGFYASVAIYPGCGQHAYYPVGTFENYPDMLVFIGADDTSVSADDCVDLVAEAVSNSSDADLFVYAGEQHGYDYDESDGVAGTDTMARTLDHFATYLGVLFADGFETGDATAWSARVP
jgi:dienelactone hydrolase